MPNAIVVDGDDLELVTDARQQVAEMILPSLDVSQPIDYRLALGYI